MQAVIDASGSPLEISEDMACRRIEKAAVGLIATNTIIAELVQDWTTKQGGKLMLFLLAFVPVVKVD